MYNHVSSQEFDDLKKRIEEVNQAILGEFSSRIVRTKRADDPQSLGLNYSLINSEPFLTNIAVVFRDVVGPPRFKIGAIKAIDIDGIRHFKRKDFAKVFTIDEIAANFVEYFALEIDALDEWDKNALINGESIELER